MNLNEYQEKAMRTCLHDSNNFAYMMLNLVAEVGEFSGKIAKAIRGGQLNMIDMQLRQGKEGIPASMAALSIELKKEAGDILWQIAGLCHVFNWDLEEVAKLNINKLQKRKDEDKIHGNGDNR